MIHFEHGNIFESKAEALVNPVNTQGVMGAGLAKDFKWKFPHAATIYQDLCREGKFKAGSAYAVTSIDNPIIIHVATKDHWKEKSRLDWIAKGLAEIRKLIVSYNIKSIAIPALGCGLGQLVWKDVKKLIELHLDGLEDVDVYVYAP